MAPLGRGNCQYLAIVVCMLGAPIDPDTPHRAAVQAALRQNMKNIALAYIQEEVNEFGPTSLQWVAQASG